MAEALKKVLVCGGRKYHNKTRIERVLDNMKSRIACVVTGGATGVDFYATRWAVSNETKVSVYPAEWTKYNRAAGHIRNQRMLDEEHPDLILAFPGGPGTANMVSRAREAGIEVIQVTDD